MPRRSKRQSTEHCTSATESAAKVTGAKKKRRGGSPKPGSSGTNVSHGESISDIQSSDSDSDVRYLVTSDFNRESSDSDSVRESSKHLILL